MNAGAGSDPAPTAPVKVYVGSQEAQMLAVRVLEFSIRRHASMPVEVFPLHHAQLEVPMPRDVRNRPRTPFSFQRFYIPQLAGFGGRAIYLDSDMQVFQDIAELWSLPFEGADLLAAREPGDAGRKPQFSVMLLNCEALHWRLDEIVAALDRGELTYETLMYEMAVARRVRAAIDPRWNSLERYEEGVTALLHYTDMNTQPWIYAAHRLGHLWMRDLLAAVDEGFITRDEVQSHVARGFVRPSLVYQLDHRLEDAGRLPAEGRSLDDGYIAPYQQMGPHGEASRGNPLRAFRAIIRTVQSSLLHRMGRHGDDVHPARSGSGD
jgi:hypothetical protein